MAILRALNRLGALCLLLAPAGTPLGTQQGEMCRAWTYAPFQCPKRHDGADGRFCCGPCHSPYCCAAEKARLDQTLCLRALRRLSALPLTKKVGEEGTTHSAGQEPKTATDVPDSREATSLQPPQGRKHETDPPTGTPSTLEPPGKTKSKMPGFFWVLLGIGAITFIFWAICKCCPNPMECYECLRYGDLNPPNSSLVQYDLRPPTCPSVHYSVRPPSPFAIHMDLGPPPPYEEREKPPPYSPWNPFNPLAASPTRDSAVVRELSVLNLGYQADEAARGSPVTLTDPAASGPTGESSGTGEVAGELVPSIIGEVVAQQVPSGAGEVVAQLEPSDAGEVVAQVMPSDAGEVVAQVMPSDAGEVVAQVMPSDAGEVVVQLEPSGAGEVAAQQVPSGAGEVAAPVVLSDAGEVAARLVPPDVGKVVAQQVPSGAGEVAARLVPPGAREAVAQLVPPDAGEAAARLVPAAQHVVIPPLEPTRKRKKPAPTGIYSENEESE